MPRRKRASAEQPIGVGLTAKQMKRRKPLSSDYLVDIDPLSDNQKRLFESYQEGKHIVAYGCAGTGKTFITLYNALRDVLSETTPYERIYLVRSLVATREIGFLPGSHEDKADIYQIPYKNMVKYMFQMPSDADFEMLYGNLKSQETIKFWSTSFLRGTTLDNAIVIVDEFQNLNFHELDSIITRVGENTKICFCGDARQSDLQKSNERNGIVDFMNVLRKMTSFDIIEFGVDDIVRSGLVKEYILAKMESWFLMFKHVEVDLPKLDRETIDGVRYYKVPDDEELLRLVSITSVTSHFNKEIFVKWRKKVGNEEADRITKAATGRGTDMHTLTEHYLKNEDLPKVRPISDFLFKISKEKLNLINNIYALEGSLYSKVLGIAGTVDCIAEYDGELAIIDFKTSKKPKPRDWIEHYFVQCMAYGCMLYELTGISVEKLVIIMACENGECVVYEERNKSKYIKLLTEYIRKFVGDKLELYGTK